VAGAAHGKPPPAAYSQYFFPVRQITPLYRNFFQLAKHPASDIYKAQGKKQTRNEKGGEPIMLLVNIGKSMAMLVAGSFAGFLFVLLLPFAWIVAGLVIFAKQLAGGLVSRAHLSFEWRPLESYLVGRRNRKVNKDGKR